MHLLTRIFIVFMLLFTSILHASVGKVSLLKGEAFVQRDIIKSALSNNATLEEKDIITTNKDAQIQIIFEDKTVVTLGSESELRIDEYLNDAQQSRVKFKFNQGTFKTITGTIGKMTPDSFKVETKTAAIGIRGIWIKGKIEPDGDTIGCLRGSIFVRSLQTGRVIEVLEGFKTFVGIDKDPSNPAGIGVGDFGNEDMANKDAKKEDNSGDYESFGYWDQEDYQSISNGVNDILTNFVDPSTQVTPASYIASLIRPGGPTYTYQGSVLGSATVGGTPGAIINNGTNTITLNANFDSSAISGSIAFNTTHPQAWSPIISGSLTTAGFSGSLSGGMGGTGTISGSFYGPTAGSISGNFVANDNYGANTATGTFSATR